MTSCLLLALVLRKFQLSTVSPARRFSFGDQDGDSGGKQGDGQAPEDDRGCSNRVIRSK